MTTLTIDRDWLLTRVNEIIGEEGPVAPEDDLMLYGLDSMGVMRLIMALEEEGITLAFEEMAKRPTIEAWWALIASRGAA